MDWNPWPGARRWCILARDGELSRDQAGAPRFSIRLPDALGIGSPEIRLLAADTASEMVVR